MNRTSLFLISMLLMTLLQPALAQDPGLINISEVHVAVKDQTLEGISAEYPIAPGKTSAAYQLYVSDSLVITATFRISPGSSGRSDIKDSSVKMAIGYNVKYKGMVNEKRADRIFYLDEERKFKEKETFNIPVSKYSNAVVRVDYTGRLQ